MIEQDKPKNQSNSRKKVTIKNIIVILASVISLVSLYLLSRYNYLLFHSSVEFFSIVIAFTIFAIAWNSRHIMDNNYLLFIGIAFLFIAGLDLVHTLAYKGMGVFPTSTGANLATQLWIATRYELSVSLLIPLLLVRRKIRSSIIFVGYSLVFALLVISIFYWGIFPQAYVDNVGLTTFKVASEYTISIILIVAVGLLIRRRKEFSDSVFKLLLAAMITAVATEMAFTLYADVYGVANMIGHLLNVVSFYLIYRALVETSLARPYELLFRNLKQSELSLTNRAVELTKVNSRLEEEITERKKAEEALKLSEEKANALIKYAPSGIYEIEYRLSPKFRSANDAMCQILGYTREELLATSPLDLLDEDSKIRFKERIMKLLSGQKIDETVEFKVKRKDGQEICAVLNIMFTYKDGKPDTAVVIAHDITERKKAEEELEIHAKNLENLVEERTKALRDSERLAAIGATAGMVGHDIRNPLQAMTSDVFLVKTELTSTPDSDEKKNALESLQEIEKNIDYINKIVADLQDFARPLNPHEEEADLKLIITELIEKNDLPENVKVSVKVEDEAVKVVADSSYINRIMYNLVINAVQAMPKGGKLTIKTQKEANDVIITVKDTGIGIPEKAKDRLFTPMFTTKSKGQGFGLAVVKRMTEALGGTVTFNSQEGKGTTFTVRLPPKKTQAPTKAQSGGV